MGPTEQSFEPAERKEALDAIREFLQGPADAGGGILLIAGPRGVGKTRLVDQALNEEIAQGPRAWGCLFGDSGVRGRLRVRRSPRGVERIVVPVAVDPFFPQSLQRPARERPNAAKSTSSDDQANPGGATDRPNDSEIIHDPESDAIRLLDNIIFALTSMVDPRSGARHGRTLRARLGFRDYYFSSLALYLPGSWSQLCLTLSVVLFGLWGSAFFFYNDWINPGNDPVGSLGTGLALSFVVLIFSWLGLRLRDWRRAAYRGARLYDLVHAQTTRQTEQHHQERSLRFQHKWTLGVGALLLLGALFFGELGELDLEWAQEPIVRKALLALLGASLIVVVLRYRYSRDHKADFGPDNRAWRITLLRRYLFVLHRCGIEPVLVFDELDKLEEPRRAPAGVVERGDCEGDSIPIELWRFQCALQRLKQSLGAEFLWILIGGQGLFASLQRHRRSSAQGMLGPLATLIRREQVLGPVSLETAQEYFCKREGRTQSADKDIKRVANLWLEAKGVYAEMVRIDAEHGLTETDYLEYAQRLAEQMARLWDPVIQHMALDLPQDSEQARFQSHSLLNREWNQVWLRTGFLELGYRLLSPHAYDLRHEAIKERLLEPIVAVKSLADGEPEALVKLGQLALYGYLLGEYAAERPGIPPEEHGPVRFEIP